MCESKAPLRTRLPQLDFVRAIACFLVIVSHSPIPPEANAVIKAINLGGWAGVDLFFVLSGFLVSGLLFEEYQRSGTVRPFRFAARRALKIYPAFYFYLVVTSIAIFFLADDLSNIHVDKLAAEALFVQNYFPATWGHTWSLAVEEHFYIAVILLVFLLVTQRRPNPFSVLPVALPIVCLGCLCWRLYDVRNGSYSGIPHATHLRIDALSFGVLLAHCRHLHPSVFIPNIQAIRIPVLLTGVALMLPSFLFDWREHQWITTYGLTSNYLGSGCIVAALVSSMRTQPVWFLFIARIGTYSYSIYLWHAVVANWIIPRISDRLLGYSPHAGWIFSIVASVVIGIIAAHLVEMPLLKIRDRMVPSQAVAPLPDSQ